MTMIWKLKKNTSRITAILRTTKIKTILTKSHTISQHKVRTNLIMQITMLKPQITTKNNLKTKSHFRIKSNLITKIHLITKSKVGIPTIIIMMATQTMSKKKIPHKTALKDHLHNPKNYN